MSVRINLINSSVKFKAIGLIMFNLLSLLSFNVFASDDGNCVNNQGVNIAKNIENENPDLNQTLSQVEEGVIDSNAAPKNSKDEMREEAIKRAALVYGAQYGRYARWEKLEQALFERSGMLSRVFNFKSMYLDNGLLQPPVLDVSDNVIHVSDSGQSRELVNKVYRVLVPANFRQRPLNWQSFLLVDNLSKPDFPRDALLPQNNDEKLVWKKNISEGFEQGIDQANQEFTVRSNALNNAYQGMFLYTLLAMRGQVAPPQVVMSNRGVDKDADGQKMAVGIHRQVIRQNSYFVAEPNHWKPIYYPVDFAAMGKAL